MMRRRHLHRPRDRRGSAYVMVLSISMLVTVIGIGALTAVQIQLRTASNTADAEDARLLAQSGVEWARAVINIDPTWRTTRRNGTVVTMPLGSGSFTVTGTDPVDGDFANSPLDPLQLDVVGYARNARQAIRLTLTPNTTAYTCLNAAMCSAGVASFTSGTTTGGLIATNANMVVAGSTTKLDTNVEATGTFSGTGYYASKTSGVAARVMPDSTVFDYYIRNGTAIAYVNKDVQNFVLSPSSNPFGATNPLGIYVIDCAGQTINVKNVRVVGTLVILNPKSDSTVDNQVNFAPAVANYPTLMVQGSITFAYDANTLNEAAGKNYNPPGTPYNGVSNVTTNDTYPSVLNGLVYVSGNLTLKNNNTLGGPLIVGGTVTSANNLIVKYDSTYLINPPPGFFDTPPMKPSASSWAQTVN